MPINDDMTHYVNTWFSLLEEKRGEEALHLYCENIIPRLLPILHENFQTTFKVTPKYDGLISLLGFTPDTVILAYRFIEPKLLVILHTKETDHILDSVVKYTRVPMASFFREPFLEKPSTNIYHALEAALKRFPRGSRIAIELTGGKKTMAGALASAAGMLDVDLLYIDYSEYMPQFHKPRPESTYIHLVQNPLRISVDLFGSLEVERAVEFFNGGKYDISRVLFEQIGSRMVNPRMAEVCASLSNFYDLWNVFAFDKALELSSSLFGQTTRFYNQISTHFQFDLDYLKKQINTVEKLAAEDRHQMMWNFYFSAIRQEKNDLYDLAALLYYRTLESIFDNALRDIADSFNRSEPNYSLFGMEQGKLRDKFVTFHNKIFKKPNFQGDLPSQIAMFDAFCLLGALDAPLVQQMNAARVAHIAKTRNFSVYAHGIRPMTTQSIEAIRKLATDMLQTYTEISNLGSIDEQRINFEFMALVLHKDE